MSDDEKKTLILEARMPALSGQAFVTARAQVLASGQSVLQTEDGVLYEVFPDGRKVRVRAVEPPLSVISGSKIAIR